jgi:release factor glutamine methyltransferase
MIKMSVDAAFKEAWKRFQAANIDSARIDARVLLGSVLGGGAEQVLAQSDRDLTAEESELFESYVRCREGLQPVSQILGEREFWSLAFKVSPHTLTPRPDTETIIEAALACVDKPPHRILDLGTGSGCILLALLSEWKNAFGVGVDACPNALAVAVENAQALGMAQRTRFTQADWHEYKWYENVEAPFDMVVSNPPYIPDADIEGLDADVRDFEPRTALAGGIDGLDSYRKIIADLPKVLRCGGWVVFEVGINQASEVTKLLVKAGFEPLENRFDLSGIERAIVARRTGP